MYYYYEGKPIEKVLEDIYCRLNILENKSLDVDNTATNKNIDEIKENIEEIELPNIHPITNFYGCSFNFANDGCAESRYYNGDDVYNPRKEV